MSENISDAEDDRKRFVESWSVRRGEFEKGFDRWLAERDRKVAEAAWSEGCEAGREEGFWGYRLGETSSKLVNPYRKGES